MTPTHPDVRHSISRALLVAGLFLAASLALTLLSPDYLSPEVAQRTLGVLTGALLVAYSNAAPKALTPLVQMRCSASTEQAIRRFTGWTLVLGGLAYMVAWLVAPFDIAAMLAMGLLGTALLLVIARTSWELAKSARA